MLCPGLRRVVRVLVNQCAGLGCYKQNRLDPHTDRLAHKVHVIIAIHAHDHCNAVRVALLSHVIFIVLFPHEYNGAIAVTVQLVQYSP